LNSVKIKQNIFLNSLAISPNGSRVFSNDAYSTAIFRIDATSMAVTEIDLPAPPPIRMGILTTP
jgi:hypothetical protein